MSVSYTGNGEAVAARRSMRMLAIQRESSDRCAPSAPSAWYNYGSSTETGSSESRPALAVISMGSLSSKPVTAPTRPKRPSQRPFSPPQGDGVYKLPREAQDRLQTALAPCRNRDAAHRLAVFLGRFWSAPKRIGDAFPIDRRALAQHQHLGLTESEVRGAIATLERVGFLIRDTLKKGSRYKATADGLHRKPILYRFDSEYGFLFAQANRRAELARQQRPAVASSSAAPTMAVRGPTRALIPAVVPMARPAIAISPKDKNQSKTEVLMGEKTLRFAGDIEPDSPLERALRSLKKAIGE